jgi:hypothetical protein
MEFDDLAPDDKLWLPPVDGVPPVVGKVDPQTGGPLMQYQTLGEVSGKDAGDGPGEHYETDDGFDVTVTF